MFGFEGSIAMQVTAMFARKSLSGAHELPPFVVFQIPPATAAAYMRAGLTGSMINERVRPPTLPGPNDCQVPSAPLVEALPSPAPAPPVPPGNSGSPNTSSVSLLSVCDGRFLLCRVENRLIFLIFSFARK